MADLFCGAGGTSTGAIQAAEQRGYNVNLTAVNHWPTAVATHTQNHPDSRHFCATIDDLNPRDLFRFGELDLLWGSPECMNHSKARGGKPINDQSRATAWCITRWAEALQPKMILVENVEEFIDWGPLGTNGKPMKTRKGDTFRAWTATLEALGYKVDHRVLCAADYGDPTTRKRLFVQAVRGRRQIRWPEPTHFKAGDDLFGQQQWVAAREVINWEHESQSIFNRKRALSENTMRRIEVGLKKYGLKPFLVPQQSRHVTKGLDQPMPTITSRGAEALCEPWIQRVGHYGKNGNGSYQHRSVDEPLSTVTTKQEHALVEPFLVKTRGTEARHLAHSAQSLDEPMGAVTGGGTHHALAEPFLVQTNFGNDARPNRAQSLDEPLRTVVGSSTQALCEPFLTKFYGNSDCASIDEPLDTVTTKGRFGLVQPFIEIDGEQYVLDVKFRMLQPDELAKAQGFPEDYEFTGSKTEITKQIGNAVPCGLSRALVGAVLDQ